MGSILRSTGDRLFPVNLEGGRIDDLDMAVGPRHGHLIDRIGAAESERHWNLDLREVTSRRHDLPSLRHLATGHFDPRADPLTIRRRWILQREANPVVGEVLLVDQKERTIARLRHDNVEVSITINVGERRRPTDDRRRQIACGSTGDRFESRTDLPTTIPEELSGLAVVLRRLNLVDLVL